MSNSLTIAVVSNTRNELNWLDNIVDRNPDILIMAGNIANSEDYGIFIPRLLNNFDGQIVAVDGPAEHYGSLSYLHSMDYLRYLSSIYPRFKFLQNSYKVIAGHVFYGGNMWSNFRDSEFVMSLIAEQVQDYNLIPGLEGIKGVKQARKIHEKFISGLENSKVRKIDFVVSSSSPTPLRVSSGSPIECNDHTNLSWLLGRNEVILGESAKNAKGTDILNWVYGRDTHARIDIRDGTRLISNPKEHFRTSGRYEPKYLHIVGGHDY